MSAMYVGSQPGGLILNPARHTSGRGWRTLAALLCGAGFPWLFFWAITHPTAIAVFQAHWPWLPGLVFTASGAVVCVVARHRVPAFALGVFVSLFVASFWASSFSAWAVGNIQTVFFAFFALVGELVGLLVVRLRRPSP